MGVSLETLALAKKAALEINDEQEQYINSKVADALEDAKDYTDRIVSNATDDILDDAKDYTDNAISQSASDTLDGAKDYTDDAISHAISESGLPPVTAGDNGKILTVVNGGWVAAPDAAEIFKFSNITVPVSAWDEDPEELSEKFPYRATVILSGITSSMVADVMFSIDDAVSGNFGPSTKSDTGAVYIYCKEIPSSSITLESVIAW